MDAPSAAVWRRCPFPAGTFGTRETSLSPDLPVAAPESRQSFTGLPVFADLSAAKMSWWDL